MLLAVVAYGEINRCSHLTFVPSFCYFLALVLPFFPPSPDFFSIILCIDRYLVKNNLLAPVFALFRENRGRDNLINSAVIELIEVRE